MRRFVVDASVAVKWVVAETGSDDAEAVIGYELIAPELLLIETGNVLWKRARRGEITAAQAIFGYEMLAGLGIEMVSVAELMPAGDASVIGAGSPHA